MEKFDLTILINQCGFLNDKQLPEFAKDYPLANILVRCGAGRFVCKAKDAEKRIKEVESAKQDYIRDVGVTADEYDRLIS